MNKVTTHTIESIDHKIFIKKLLVINIFFCFVSHNI